MSLMGIYVRTSIETDGTSIEQQKKEGIKFCEKHGFEYMIYEDEGKSGFKIDDDGNPFKNRKGLSKLVNDIENKIIDKVWVYEHSRLSRNQNVSFVLFKIFKKYNITVYEKDKLFDMNDPQTQMIQGILTQISQYERHLIVNRTTRGLHDTINRGIRGYIEFYGYKKEGRTEDGYVNWVSVKSEIENIRYSYQKFLEGSSVKSIISQLYKDFDERERSILVKKWTRILRHFDYTGYSLNTDGLEIFNKFKRCEIDSISELNDEKYYVKSINFPLQLVSIEDWITVVDKLQVHKIIYKDKMRRSDNEIFTGIIQCPYCELRYYYVDDKRYTYYKHFPKKTCGQRPKSIRIDKMNRLIKVFFFYFYLVYDDTKQLIEESQRLNKINQMELKEKINDIETKNRKIDKQIMNFQSVYEKPENMENLDKLNLILDKEVELKKEKEVNFNILSKLKVEFEELNQRYENDKLELTYYDIKETIINFFEEMTIDEKRLSLVKIIKNCQLFNKHLVIDTGKILFIFNVEEDYILPEYEYNKFKNDKKYKDDFLNSSSLIDNDGNVSQVIKDFVNGSFERYTEEEIDKYIISMLNFFIIRTFGDISIREIFMKKKGKIDTKIIMEKQLTDLGIDYSLSGIEKIVSFTEL